MLEHNDFTFIYSAFLRRHTRCMLMWVERVAAAATATTLAPVTENKSRQPHAFASKRQSICCCCHCCCYYLFCGRRKHEFLIVKTTIIQTIWATIELNNVSTQYSCRHSDTHRMRWLCLCNCFVCIHSMSIDSYSFRFSWNLFELFHFWWLLKRKTQLNILA